MKIVIVGIGYVGLSLSVLLSQKFDVVALDISKDRVDKVNNRISPIKDDYIEKYLKEKSLNLRASSDFAPSYKNADLIFVSVPTNYCQETNSFDTSIVEDSISQILSVNKDVPIVIKSTIPVGFTRKMVNKFHSSNIFFSPEFLRESKALYDNLYPSRIIVGCLTENRSQAIEIGNILSLCSLKPNIDVLCIGLEEAEACKLFANTFLAVRISFFNELDYFCLSSGIKSKDVIKSICLDPRIGDFYNNPSFGYGGYCLPKDTKQLKQTFGDVPQRMITAAIESNEIRKKFIIDDILSYLQKSNSKNKVVGIYRLTMKSNSDNFRESSIKSIISGLVSNGTKVVLYEPTISDDSFSDLTIDHDFEHFCNSSCLIIANRMDNVLIPYETKVYTRDIFFRD